jgi:hypothetical protein
MWTLHRPFSTGGTHPAVLGLGISPLAVVVQLSAAAC